jgi:hypothetical protein
MHATTIYSPMFFVFSHLAKAQNFECSSSRQRIALIDKHGDGNVTKVDSNIKTHFKLSEKYVKLQELIQGENKHTTFDVKRVYYDQKKSRYYYYTTLSDTYFVYDPINKRVTLCQAEDQLDNNIYMMSIYHFDK